MYQWLLAAVGSLLAAARRPAPPPAPRKRPLRSVEPSLEEDADESPAKRKKSAYVVSEADSSGEVNLPAKADECCETSVNTVSSTTDGGEEPTLNDSSIPTSSVFGAEMLQIGQMPFESSAFFNRVTLALSPMTIPQVSTNGNGEHCTKPTPEDTLTPRPPIKEHSATSGVGKAVRPHCAAEEDVQREEKEKFKQLLKLLRDKYAKYCPTPKPMSCRSSPFELLQAMEREVMAALGTGEPDEVMSSAFKLKVTREDIQTLNSYQWLNDEVINFYMNLLVERNKKDNYPTLYAFSTFFYPKLISLGYGAVRRWTRNVDLFKYDIILVPIHLREHWTLVVVDVRKKTITYFDSLGKKRDKICEIVLQYLQEESWDKQKVKLSCSEWTLRNMEAHEIPQQSNGNDCGVFMCKYADYVSREKPITFTENDIPYFRKRMVWEIIHQQLLPE
ncbi:hypothetical protein ASZ78_001574 [Callipepla squamata]|uniref:Ubiquitin-like protease family profile domain-containing protein n=1 Tax=Callipepla squamata TaxID=9009 RepID=A0A226NCP4_CALSU|nr:hypothetical protein ASZ78_001574 [Callipepla squamata]